MSAAVASHGAIAGNGLFACRGIMPGDSILTDTALVAVLKSESLGELHELLLSSGQYARLEGELGRGIFRGDPEGRQAQEHRVWSEEVLSDAAGPAERSERARSLLAMRFNAHMDASKRRQLLFPVISKSNHSCLANASVCVHEGSSAELICLHPIAEDEEITVSYLSDQQLGMPVEYRQGRLNELWEFTCSCARCACSHDDTRCFACPQESCVGQCSLARDDCLEPAAQVGCRKCSSCGVEPPQELLASWHALENQIGRLVSSLPEGMFSAWAHCEEFASAHPQHWLGSTWRRHLAAHNQAEAKHADTQEEAEGLRAEAIQALDAADRYIEVLLGAAREEALWPCIGQAGHREGVEVEAFPAPSPLECVSGARPHYDCSP